MFTSGTLIAISGYDRPIFNIRRTIVLNIIFCAGHCAGIYQYFIDEHNLSSLKLIFINCVYGIAIAMFIVAIYKIFLKLRGRNEKQALIVMLDLNDILLLTYGSNLIMRYLINQSLNMYYAGEYSQYAQAGPDMLIAYNVTLWFFVIIVTIIPERLARYEYTQSIISLNNVRKSVENDISPGLQLVHEGLTKLRNPTELQVLVLFIYKFQIF